MVNIDMTKTVNDAVLSGMKKAGLEDTPDNRLMVLSGVHRGLTLDNHGSPMAKMMLSTVESEIIRLENAIGC